MDSKVRVCFLFVAATSMLPYNLFMNAHEYFYYKFRNTSDEENSTIPASIIAETHLQRNFEGFLTLFGGIACIIGAAVNLIFTNKLSNTFRVVAGHISVILVFLPTIAFTYIDTDDFQHPFFYGSIVLAAISSSGSMGFIGGGILGLAATYPDTCMQTVMIGQAFPGVLSAALSIVCQAFTRDAINNGRVYFFIALSWTILSLFFYIYISKDSAKRQQIYLRLPEESDTRPFIVEDDHDEGDQPEPSEISSLTTKQQYIIVWRQCQLDLLNTGLVLFITLSGFPAISSLVKSTSSNITWAKYFSSICCFLLFNVGDVFGRFLANSVILPRRPLLVLCLIRILFIPLLIVCNVSPRYHSPSLLPFDGVFILTIILFALTNGFTLSTSILNVTRSADKCLREVAGSMTNLTCVVSSLLGSLMGVAIVALL